MNDNWLIYYDWLADMAMTSHIMHQREAFTNYTPMGNSSVTGVGGKEVLILGCGTVELNSKCSARNKNSQSFISHEDGY